MPTARSRFGTPGRESRSTRTLWLLMLGALGLWVSAVAWVLFIARDVRVGGDDLPASGYTTDGGLPEGVKYLTFTPWNGGWNNRRMSLEIAMLLAAAMNRTLVLPPRSTLAQMSGELGYEDFFNVTRLGAGVVRVMPWSEFYPMIASSPSFGPPVTFDCKGRTKNTAAMCDRVHVLRAKGVHHFRWSTLNETATLPLDAVVAPEDDAAYTEFNWRKVDITDRLRDVDDRHKVIHFHKMFFGNFYQVLFFPHASQRRRAYRMVRDGVAGAFHAHLDTAAAGVAGGAELGGGAAGFDCVHVRRGDFKRFYQPQILEAGAVVRNIHPLLRAPAVYIATDEPPNSDYLRELRAAFDSNVRVYTAADFPQLQALRSAELPIVEMLLCSRARTFVGTKLSTFSAYITRLRGYNPALFDKGVYTTSEHYTEPQPSLPPARATAREYRARQWSREFPVAWEGIDT